LEEKFGVKHQRIPLNFNATPLQASEQLIAELEEGNDMPIKSEKARCEWIVVPILKELRRKNNKFFTIYSGDTLDADKEKGLYGECDFILAKDTKSYEVNAPIFQIVEAKRNDLEEGIRQCAAQLLGARIFNAKRNIFTEDVYGCATTGDDWIFIKLTDNQIYIDTKKYYLSEINQILGVFQFVIDYNKFL
jgi:hypothetical protein